MVWPFSSSSSDGSNGSSKDTSDPYSKLDPSLRKFLDRESTSSYSPSKAPATEQTAREKVHLTPNTQEPETPRPVPTLYPDGRYADLWKNYRPQGIVEAEGKSDQEKLADVLETYKTRKNSISKAALENCAQVHLELNECFRKPNMKQRMVMCRDETRALDRCLTMNKRFLGALGYLSTLDKTREEEEAVQMHADRLFTRMLQQEKAIAKAKAEGKEVPELDSMFDSGPKPRPAELDDLTEEGKQRLAKRTEGLTPLERDLEERAFASEIRAGTETIAQLERHREEVRQERARRIESGKTRTFDKFNKWLGW